MVRFRKIVVGIPRRMSSRTRPARGNTGISPTFEHDAPIPERYRGRIFGANISPDLAWTQPLPRPTPPNSCSSCRIPTCPLASLGPGSMRSSGRASLGNIPENELAHPSTTARLRHAKGARGHRARTAPTATSSNCSRSIAGSSCRRRSRSTR